MNNLNRKTNYRKIENLFLCKKQIDKLKHKILGLIESPCQPYQKRTNNGKLQITKELVKPSKSTNYQPKIYLKERTQKKHNKIQLQSPSKSQKCSCRNIFSAQKNTKASLDNKASKSHSCNKRQLSHFIKNDLKTVKKGQNLKQNMREAININQSRKKKKQGKTQQKRFKSKSINRLYYKLRNNNLSLSGQNNQFCELDVFSPNNGKSQHDKSKDKTIRFTTQQKLSPVQNTWTQSGQKRKLTQLKTCQTLLNSSNQQFAQIQQIPYLKMKNKNQSPIIKINDQQQDNQLWRNIFQKKKSQSKYSTTPLKVHQKKKISNQMTRNNQIELMKNICKNTSQFINEQIQPFVGVFKYLPFDQQYHTKNEQILLKTNHKNSILPQNKVKLWINDQT